MSPTPEESTPWNTGRSSLQSANLQQLQVNKRGHATATGVSWSTVPRCGTVCRLRYAHRTRHWTYLKIDWKLSSSKLSTECAFAALANLHGINHLIIIIIIIIIITVFANRVRYDVTWDWDNNPSGANTGNFTAPLYRNASLAGIPTNHCHQVNGSKTRHHVSSAAALAAR